MSRSLSKKVKILLLTILTVFGSIQVIAQTTQPTFDQSYKANVGDNMQYEYTKVIFNNESYLASSFLLENGTVIRINVTAGTLLAVKVTTINSTTNSIYKTAYTQETLTVPEKGTFTGKEYYAGIFLRQAYDNRSMVDNYVSYINETSNIRAYADDTILTYESRNYGNNTGGISFQYVWNWHTGWLNHYSYEIIQNNKKTEDLRIDIYGDGLAQTIIQGTIPVSVNVIPIGIGGLVLFSWK